MHPSSSSPSTLVDVSESEVNRISNSTHLPSYHHTASTCVFPSFSVREAFRTSAFEDELVHDVIQIIL